MSLRLATMRDNNLDSRLRGNDRYRHPREGGGPVGVRKSFVFNLHFGYVHGSEGSRRVAQTSVLDVCGRRLAFIALAAFCVSLLAPSLSLAQVSELRLQSKELAPESRLIPPDQVMKAVAAARQAIRENPQSAQAYLSLASALRAGGDDDGAGNALDSALQLDPKLSRAWLEKGLIADQTGTFEEALGDYKKAADFGSNSANARLQYASMLFRNGKFAEVKSQLQAILRLDPGNAKALNGLGLLELQDGDAPAAAAKFRQAILHQPHFSVAQMNLGNALLQLGDGAGARDAYQKALQDQPNDSMAVYGLARALSKLNDRAGASAEFAKARTLMNLETAELRAAGENVRGLKLWYAGDLDGAAAAFRSALSVDAKFADAHNNLGGVLWQQNHKQAAEREFDAAVRDQPGFAKALNNLGNALIQSGQLQQGIQDLHAAVNAQPAFASARLNLGIALLRAGSKQPAEAEFRRTLLLDPKNAAARVELGLAMITSPPNVPKDAHDEIEAGLELNPSLMRAVPEAVLHALAMADNVIPPDPSAIKAVIKR
jgi:tetratricopeptide (TPR) repeat protein